MLDFDMFIASPSRWHLHNDDELCCAVCSSIGRGFCNICIYRDDPLTIGEIVELRKKENKND